MCPACIATVTLLAAKVTSAGGLTALVSKKLRAKARANAGEGSVPAASSAPVQRAPHKSARPLDVSLSAPEPGRRTGI